MTGRAVTITVYVLILATVAALDLAARRGWLPILTFSGAVATVARFPLGRAALLLLWWWLGWHFLARSGPAPL
ncbi:MAG: DUF6186 family protein [Actinomycetota bacterium]|nr:DUF6186 family protein [Actinomycetota bacterium]